MKLKNKNLFTLGIALIIIMSGVLSCSLAPEKIEVYVSTLGSDDNNGSKNSPFKSIQKAVDVGNRNNLTINVAKGVYTPDNGLNAKTNGVEIFSVTNFNLLGGWNDDFSSRSGYSELDGKNNLYHIINLDNVKNVVIDGFVIRGGNANGANPHSSGGGIDTYHFNDSVIKNCIISNNTASDSGGGICLYKANNNIINGTVYNNAANDKGGGIYLNNTDNNTISGSIYNNTANISGGGIYLYEANNNTINGSVHNNTANEYNGVNGGGGIYLSFADNNTINGSIYSNTTKRNGGGIYLYGNSNIINSSIYNNTTYLYGGGIYLFYANSNIINGSVYSNFAYYDDGGGIYFWNANNNTIDGSVHNNIAGNGGGIYFSYFATNNIISGSILSNTAANGYKGGGVYFRSDATNNIFTATCVVKWNTVDGGSVGDGGGVYNDNIAGSQISNAGFTISDNSPDDWAGGAPSAP